MHPLQGWWRSIRGLPPLRDIVDDAHDIAMELKTTAQELRERLAIFETADDPFVAMMIKVRSATDPIGAAELFEREQEAKIWRGPASPE